MSSYDPKIVEIFERLAAEHTPTQCYELQRLLEWGFTREAAAKLLEEGILEEETTGCHAVSGFPFLFTRSAVDDLGIWNDPAKVQTVLSSVPASLASNRCVDLVGGRGWLLCDGPFRIVFREKARKIVVFAIGIAGINPETKIWRYFDQSKAEKLIESSSLYFCRLDQLTDDPHEGRLPHFQRQNRARAFQEIFGERMPQVIKEGDEIFRGTTYVSCWTRRKYESYLAWKHYCSKENGGFAVVSTWRRVSHIHALLRKQDDQTSCRSVGYLDTIMDNYLHDEEGEQAFWKKRYFSDETEIRFVVRRTLAGTNAEILKHIKEKLPPGEPIPCDLSVLTEEIITNPFASNAQKQKIWGLIEDKRPFLLGKVRESEIRDL